MRFQLLKLIVWPKSKEFAPQIIQFEPGKLNVITGSSRTGKSAIIPIIDYCLASSDCLIPIDTIRDYSSWYGVIFQTESEQILISRKVPSDNKPSNEFYLLRGSLVSVPPVIIESNESIDGVKHILNSISGVSYIGLNDEEDDDSGYRARLGFRDLMALVFQNQDIIANQNILFYKTYAHEHREKLRNWFPFILGAETIEMLAARQRLRYLEKRLSQLKKEYEKAKNISFSWMSDMLGHLNVAKEYGILKTEVSYETEPDELLQIARSILENNPDYTKTRFEDIETANKEIENLEREEEIISLQIGVVKKRLSELERLKNGLADYSTSQKKRAERLRISKWLESIVSSPSPCPACGSIEHPKEENELLKIAFAFQKYEEQSIKAADVPTSFIREEERLKKELQVLLDEKEKLQARFDLVIARDKAVQEEFQRRKSMFKFLGHLQASLETFEKLVDGGDLQNAISILEYEYQKLIELTDINVVQKRVDIAIIKISQGILKHLKTLDVENKYRSIAPRFNIKDLNIAVLSNDQHWHYLSEVGSASNWVAFHIGLMCSLQEYFLELETSCVPTFVIMDQPSQVYFPKLHRGKDYSEDEPRYEDEDVEAVKSIFRTIAKSIFEKKGSWQCIVLDHAESSIYGDIEGVYEAAEWRYGKKLIPEEWYS